MLLKRFLIPSKMVKFFWEKERLNQSLRVEIKCSPELQQFISEFKNI